jgi:hypothetical protein
MLGQGQQVIVLLFLQLNELPLVVSKDLPFLVGSILRDHHERAEEDGFE